MVGYLGYQMVTSPMTSCDLTAARQATGGLGGGSALRAFFSSFFIIIVNAMQYYRNFIEVLIIYSV